VVVVVIVVLVEGLVVVLVEVSNWSNPFYLGETINVIKSLLVLLQQITVRSGSKVTYLLTLVSSGVSLSAPTIVL